MPDKNIPDSDDGRKAQAKRRPESVWIAFDDLGDLDGDLVTDGDMRPFDAETDIRYVRADLYDKLKQDLETLGYELTEERNRG